MSHNLLPGIILNRCALSGINCTEQYHGQFAKSACEFYIYVYKNKQFSRKDYLKSFPNISIATASRDLQKAVIENRLEKTGEKALAMYRFH